MDSITKNAVKTPEQIISLIDKMRSEKAVTGLIIDAVTTHCNDDEVSEGALYQWQRFSSVIDEAIEIFDCYVSDKSPE